MATVTNVEHAPAKIKSVTLKFTPSEVYDLQEYIKGWYSHVGYGDNRYKTNGLHKTLTEALTPEPAATAVTPVF